MFSGVNIISEVICANMVLDDAEWCDQGSDRGPNAVNSIVDRRPFSEIQSKVPPLPLQRRRQLSTGISMASTRNYKVIYNKKTEEERATLCRKTECQHLKVIRTPSNFTVRACNFHCKALKTEKYCHGE